ncbi:MAG: hypothetical protein LBI45_07765 [Bacteroidales bacterium]|nr:hypothetical protein [Bacteroidales bacterium]
MYKTLKQFLFFLFFYNLFVFSFAQNETNNPYSGFGLGSVAPRSNVSLNSMGGVGYALQNPYYINFKNPASYAAFDSLSFIADLSFGVVNQQLNTYSQSQEDIFTQLGYLTIGVPVMKFWRMSAGIIPFSDVGYGITDTTYTEHFGKVDRRFTGSGGVHLLYWGNAFKVCKGLTVGVNLSYLFGTINTTNFVEFELENTFNTKISNFRYLDGIHFSGGIQYNTTFNEKHRLGLGIVFENAVKVWSIENLLILEYLDQYHPFTGVDTVLAKMGKDAVKSSAKFPQTVGGGIAYVYKDKIVTAVDVTWQNWKKFSMSNCNDSLKNNFITELGIQFVPNSTSTKYYNKINFRLGSRFSTGYLYINERLISEFAISAGLGFPLKTFNTRSSINIMFEYSKLGTLKNDLILQNCYKLSFNFILQERWYQRRKID